MGCACKSFTILCRLSSDATSLPLFSICYPYFLWSRYELPLSRCLSSHFHPPYLLLWFFLALHSILFFPSLACASSSLSTNFVSHRLLIPLFSPSVSFPLLIPHSLLCHFFQFLQASSVLSLHLPANHPLSLKSIKSPLSVLEQFGLGFLSLFSKFCFLFTPPPPLITVCVCCIYIIVPLVLSQIWMGPLGDHTS